MVRQTVAEALMQTASMMKAEEMYTTRRGEFTSMVEDQVRNGIYETSSRIVNRKGADGEEFNDKEVFIKLGSDGKPIIRKISPFQTYGVEVVQFVIKEIDFDKTIDALISKKKEMEQQKVVAVAAELAKVQFPGMMILGGGNGSNGHALNPFDAVGLESFMCISKEIGDQRQDNPSPAVKK